MIIELGVAGLIAWYAKKKQDSESPVDLNVDLSALPLAPISTAGLISRPEAIVMVPRATISYTEFDYLILPAAARYGVPVAWVKAFIGKESTFRVNPPVRVNDQSYGLMQLIPQTARALGFTGRVPALVDGNLVGPNDLLDPATNIDLGVKLMGQLIRSYGMNFERCYSAYNSGRPDLYKTSTEVAANVRGALDWLAKFE